MRTILIYHRTSSGEPVPFLVTKYDGERILKQYPQWYFTKERFDLYEKDEEDELED
jgi:hypothetical protein